MVQLTDDKTIVSDNGSTHDETWSSTIIGDVSRHGRKTCFEPCSIIVGVVYMTKKQLSPTMIWNWKILGWSGPIIISWCQLQSNWRKNIMVSYHDCNLKNHYLRHFWSCLQKLIYDSEWWCCKICLDTIVWPFPNMDGNRLGQVQSYGPTMVCYRLFVAGDHRK